MIHSSYSDYFRDITCSYDLIIYLFAVIQNYNGESSNLDEQLVVKTLINHLLVVKSWLTIIY